MPGIDTRAPGAHRDQQRPLGIARAESGRGLEPREMLAITWGQSPAGGRRAGRVIGAHASVVIVKPGGTGMPRLVISASSQPLPPSRLRSALDPSALPPPKEYTYFAMGAVAVLGTGLGTRLVTLADGRAGVNLRLLTAGVAIGRVLPAGSDARSPEKERATVVTRGLVTRS